MVDGECDGHRWCHKRIDIGHRTRQGFSASVAVSLAVFSRLSYRLFVCPPPVRSVPGSSSFPSPSVLLPPTHCAFGCDDVGDRRFPFGAGASVARPCSSVSSVSVGSSVASRSKLHPAGARKLPSCSVVYIRRLV